MGQESGKKGSVGEKETQERRLVKKTNKTNPKKGS